MTEIQSLLERALATSTADGCVAIGTVHSETNLRFAANSLTTNGQMQSQTVSVVSIVERGGDRCPGVVTRSVTTEDELVELVRAADAAARAADPAEDSAPLVEDYPHDDDWAGEPGRTGVEVFERFAAELGEQFASWRAADRLLFGFAEHQLTSSYLASSTGLRRRFDQPDGRLELNAKSGDMSGSAWFGQHYPDYSVVDIARVAADLETRLGWAQTRIDLPAGRYETILPPTAVADLMIETYWSAAARDADEGRSVYSKGAGTRLGERMTDLPLTLRSDPDHPELRCSPFQVVTGSGSMTSVFDNGAPNPAVSWMQDGVLTELIRPRGYAARVGATPALAIDNLVLEGGDDSGLDEMIAATERGLLLTCLWYIRVVDPQTMLVTGLTRDGVYLVEQGQVRGAVNNFRFNETPVDLWRRATSVGRSEHTLSREWSDFFSRTSMPAMRIPDFNMSTVSQAS
ncbi:MAG: metallopeptidase TldD-related protein [Jatrophihabitans sp.]|uniref:metallopeptidase TldD-related protein n=1 Tax=Jatrophihabitans sp. TaxID=1932789 RepID=UPI003F8026DC